MIWKTTMFTWFAMIILLPTLLICQTDRTETKADKSEAPYFIIPDNEGETELLPLEETSAQVSISGIIADVRVTQVYKNYGKKTIEAIYTFPASTRAAVYQLKMIIGERIIEAKIQERE
ncbi:MAG: trypsin, partial [Calditrichales bacterium]